MRRGVSNVLLRAACCLGLGCGGAAASSSDSTSSISGDDASPAGTTQVTPIEERCDVRAYTRPHQAASVQQGGEGFTLPATEYGVILHIVGMRGDRFHYDSLELLGEEVMPASAYDGGWIPRGQVTLHLNQSEVNPELAPPHPVHMYDKPGGVPIRTFLQESVTTELLGCRDQWAMVRVSHPEGSVDGWLGPEGHCGNPVTTCPITAPTGP